MVAPRDRQVVLVYAAKQTAAAGQKLTDALHASLNTDGAHDGRDLVVAADAELTEARRMVDLYLDRSGQRVPDHFVHMVAAWRQLDGEALWAQLSTSAPEVRTAVIELRFGMRALEKAIRGEGETGGQDGRHRQED